MAKVKLRNPSNRRLVGKAIFDAWAAAIQANPTAPVIDRRALILALSNVLDLQDTGASGKRIEFDIVFDTDLDDKTRLVWLSIPTPDADFLGSGQTWEQWKHDYYDGLSDAEKEQKEDELGLAVLFGCGR